MTTFFDPFQELDRITGALLRQAGASASVMPVDLYREGDHFVLNADLPGVDPAAVDLSVDGQTLIIRAERTISATDGVQWLARERADTSFVRQFLLGEGLDAEKIAATYDNGVLHILIPVADEAKPRKIQVGSGQNAQKSVGAAAPAAEPQAEQAEQKQAVHA